MMLDGSGPGWRFDRNCAILVIGWRRPKETKKVIEAIRKAKPKRVYFACDGADGSKAEETRKVQQTRELVKEIDWDCSLETYFSESNRGCRMGVNSAIDWFFENEDYGIILEDDCIPEDEFFGFCSQLLRKYKGDKRVRSISGTRHAPLGECADEAYYFSRYPHCWGWATWRDRWQSHDKEMSGWSSNETKRMVKETFIRHNEWKYWKKIWDGVYFRSEPDTWDYQWVLSCRMVNGLSIIPRVSLVSNIGFSEDATHTKCLEHMAPATGRLGSIKHPLSVVADEIADQSLFIEHYNVSRAQWLLEGLRRMKRRLG